MLGTHLKTIDLGELSAFEDFPAPVWIGRALHYLTRSSAGSLVLLSAECPHQGGTVSWRGDCYECPKHGWRFDGSGHCTTAPNQRLTETPTRLEAGRVLVEVSDGPAAPESGRWALEEDVSIGVHAYTCLEVRWRDFAVVTDPWLSGPAFLGAWIQYPPPAVQARDLAPDALIVTHEHSDHFHVPTLQQLDQKIPVYVPDFPNRRLVDRLSALGFEHVHPMAFGVPNEVKTGVRFTCYEPTSVWNDAIVLIEMGTFRLLNLNDAGLNARIASLVGPVTVAAAAFSAGASGYPLTWDHVGAEEAERVLLRARGAGLRLLKDVARVYQARHVLPFGAHFALWHPSQRKYFKQLKQYTVDDAADALRQSGTSVIDILPGETWRSDGSTQRVWDRRAVYDPEAIDRYLDERFDAGEFAAYHPPPIVPEGAEVEAYFLALNRNPAMAHCEDLTFAVIPLGPDGNELKGWTFRIEDKRLGIVQPAPGVADVTIRVPAGILKQIVSDGLSWDEAMIGYWCRFSRNQHVFHVGFWRLLQAPYASAGAALDRSAVKVTVATSIAELLDRHGAAAERSLNRYGLYCSGCWRSPAETLASGGRSHGLPEHQIERLLVELERAFSEPESGAAGPLPR